ncbi:MAG: (d)CMP kinase [Candidatus Nitrospinota bacterium M3_3B_026]
MKLGAGGLPKNFVVAIDGPAGSGKSTMARLLAARIGGVYIDTGAMYRAVTARALDTGADPADEEAAARIARSIRIEFLREENGQKTIVDGENLTERIRRPDVNDNVSIVSAHPGVRQSMAALQRRMGESGRVVMEGRDIGSNVFPGAMFKFFLVADDAVRAERRLKDFKKAGVKTTRGRVLKNIQTRDRIDSGRAAAPLVKPQDAVEINTTRLGVDEVLNIMIERMFSKTESPCRAGEAPEGARNNNGEDLN